jgi:hypothetical protein
MAARIIVRIELTPDAKRRLMEVSKRFGMTQIAATSRLVEWFAGQSELVQAAILGQYPSEIESDVARLILQKMANPASAAAAAGAK